MGRYRFLVRPRWLLSHLLVAVLVVVMISLGFWQLRRLHERRAANELISARSNMAPTSVDALAGSSADELRYRTVRATGTYDAGLTRTISSRTESGGPGGWTVTPMRSGTRTVIVLRGFERLNADGSIDSPAPPSSTATVTGYAMPISRLDPIAKRDLSALMNSSGALPFIVQAKASDPSDAGTLQPVPLPQLGDGPHLGYAVQWFIFSAIALGGYPLVLRREAARQLDAAQPRDA